MAAPISIPIRTSSLHSRSDSASLSGSSTRISTDSALSIQLLNAMPSTMPRSAPPTPQRLTLVATILSNYLTEMDLPHAFLGRFALSLRGAPYNHKWVDVEISRPTIGGTTKVKDTLSAHPDFSVHAFVDSQNDTVSKLLVSHKIGVYLRVSVGTITHLRRKTIQVSAHTTESRGPSVLPLLTSARHFLETVIVAASKEGKEEDADDLVWMHEHLRVELLNERSTLKKTWDEGRLQAVVEKYPIINEAVVDLGLAVIADDGGSRTATSSTAARTQ